MEADNARALSLVTINYKSKTTERAFSPFPRRKMGLSSSREGGRGGERAISSLRGSALNDATARRRIAARQSARASEVI